MPLKIRCSLFTGAAILAASTAAMAANAALTAVYPPPGLYRVDTQSNLQQLRGTASAQTQQYTQEGASGNVQLKGASAGHAPVTTNLAGQGEATVCMKPLPATGTMPVATNCKGGTPVAGPGSMRYTSVCGGMKLDITIRKVDAKTWEYRTVMVDNGAPMTGQQDFAGMRRVLDEQAKNAVTPKERADAAAALAQMGTYEAEMKKNATELSAAQAAMAKEQGGGAGAGHPITERTSIQRFTRIAETCS
jgi:hypothetical protein